MVNFLKSPTQFVEFANRQVESAYKLVETVPHTKPGVPFAVVLDTMSDKLCLAADVAQACRSLHPGAEWIEAGTEARGAVEQCMAMLNSDHRLYDATMESLEVKDLDAETRRMLDTSRVEFEAGGVQLSDSDRNRVVNLQMHLSGLLNDFLGLIREDDFVAEGVMHKAVFCVIVCPRVCVFTVAEGQAMLQSILQARYDLATALSFRVRPQFLVSSHSLTHTHTSHTPTWLSPSAHSHHPRRRWTLCTIWRHAHRPPPPVCSAAAAALSPATSCKPTVPMH
jgi:hypothetical protein